MSKNAAIANPPAERPRPGQRTNAPLARVTANLTARSTRALEQVVAITGDSQTDAINRALQVYAYLEQILAEGGEVYTRRADQDQPVSLRFF
jgi:hypothetical protein